MKKEYTKNMLVQKHIRLSSSNLDFLEEYINEHADIHNLSEAVRDILYSLELDDRRTDSKLSSIGKDVSVILELIKRNIDDDTIVDSAINSVENTIQASTTKQSEQGIDSKNIDFLNRK